MKVTIGKHQVRDRMLWVVSRRVAGKRKRTHFTSKAAAESEAGRLRDEIKFAGETWANLSMLERSSLIGLYLETKKRGIDLHEALKRILEVPVNTSPTLLVVIAQMLEVKTGAGRSRAYVAALESVLNCFSVGRQATPINEITLQDVESFIFSKATASGPTLRSRLSTLFKFAVRRGYRNDNPCARLEPITLPKHSPTVLTPSQFQTCLEWLKALNPRALPWFVLTCCCGLRPHEAHKTRRADINVKEGWVKVEAQTSKVRRRRVVYPKAEAMALLGKYIRNGKLPFGPLAARRVISGTKWKNKSGKQFSPGLRQTLGWKVWPRDITRHSAASYWLADCESTAAVARYLGHSETILLRHYAALVTKEQAKRFWAVCAV